MTRHVLATAAAILLSTMPALGTVLIPVDLVELAQDATLIARGSVVAAEARWTAGRRGIETVVTLDAESVLKGSATGVVHFVVPGGTLGRYRNVVMGAPRFEEGQRVLVFLGATGPEVPHLLGLSQGVYRVGVSAAGTAVVSPMPVMPGVDGPVVRGTAARPPTPLADFERAVRELGAAR